MSAYAFSTENWKRSPDEVRFLMGFNRDVIRRRRDEMHALGVRVRWAGRRPRLWRSVVRELEEAEELTRDNDVCTLTMCVNYGGRAEIADAAAALALDVAAGRVDPAQVDEKVLARYLDEPDMPDVDLFLRTSGEQRTSQLPAVAVGVRGAGLPRRALAGRRPAAPVAGRASCTPRATAGTAARCRTSPARRQLRTACAARAPTSSRASDGDAAPWRAAAAVGDRPGQVGQPADAAASSEQQAHERERRRQQHDAGQQQRRDATGSSHFGCRDSQTSRTALRCSTAVRSGLGRRAGRRSRR